MTFEIRGIEKTIVHVVAYNCWIVEESRMVIITEPQKLDLISSGHIFK